MFIRKIGKEATSKDLEDIFRQFGGIISCKVSLEEKTHKSRGYGFVCFQDAEYAQKALEDTKSKDQYIGVKFNPKKTSDQRKAFNNIFIKNLPQDVTEDDIKELFGVYGNITSLH